MDHHDNCGKIHLYKFGTPVEASNEGVKTQTSDAETENEPNGGISGFPVMTIGFAILLFSIILKSKNARTRA